MSNDEYEDDPVWGYKVCVERLKANLKLLPVKIRERWIKVLRKSKQIKGNLSTAKNCYCASGAYIVACGVRFHRASWAGADVRCLRGFRGGYCSWPSGVDLKETWLQIPRELYEKYDVDKKFGGYISCLNDIHDVKFSQFAKWIEESLGGQQTWL